MCFLGGGSYVLAATFGLSVNAILWTFRFLVLLLPPVVAWVVYRLCQELSARDGVPTAAVERVRVREVPRRLLRGAGSRVLADERTEPVAGD